MKTLEQLAREAGMERDGDGWFTPSGDPAGEYDVSTESLSRFRAACRAEALEEAAQRLDADPERMAFATEFAAAIREMK